MEWIDIKDFGKDYIFEGAFNLCHRGSDIIITMKSGKDIVIRSESFCFYRYKCLEDVPDYFKEWCEAGKCRLKEYDDKTVVVFTLSRTHFKNIIAYMDTDDMLKELNKMQK